jgi:hypothetical protein
MYNRCTGQVYQTVIIRNRDVGQGGPSWTEALVGEVLGLPAYDVTEPEIKERIDAATYDLEVGLADIALDSDEIAKAIKKVGGDWAASRINRSAAQPRGAQVVL